MRNASQSDANDAPKKTFIPSLSLAFFATGKLDVISSLFLVDIALTFFGTTNNAALGAASQIIVFSNIAAVVFGLLNGMLSIRFRHKTILVFGAICIIIGTVGCILTPNFFGMQIFYPFDGIGSVTVGAMAFALIGELLPLNKRGKAIGYVTASGMLAATIGFPIAGVLAGINGWRSVLSLYVLPVSILALLAIIFGVPSSSSECPKTIRKDDYVQSFKQVLLNKSATACLFGNMFMQAAGVWSFFAATFWRQQYLLSIESAAGLTLAVTLIFASGNLIGGRLVNRTGRKRLVIMTWTIRSLLIPLVVFMPDFNSAVITSFLATAIGGIATTAGPSLTLEQAPDSRGTMMSINTVFGSLGATIGSFAGGAALTQAGYYGLGVAFGLFGLLSVLIILLLAKEPYKK